MEYCKETTQYGIKNMQFLTAEKLPPLDVYQKIMFLYGKTVETVLCDVCLDLSAKNASDIPV
jgi:hypothetical protein